MTATDSPITNEPAPEVKRAQLLAWLRAKVRGRAVVPPPATVAAHVPPDERLTAFQRRRQELEDERQRLTGQLEEARAQADHDAITRLRADLRAVELERETLGEEVQHVERHVTSEEASRQFAALYGEGSQIADTLAEHGRLLEDAARTLADRWQDYGDAWKEYNDWSQRRRAHEVRYGAAPAAILLEQTLGLPTHVLQDVGTAAKIAPTLDTHRRNLQEQASADYQAKKAAKDAEQLARGRLFAVRRKRETVQPNPETVRNTRGDVVRFANPDVARRVAGSVRARNERRR